MNTWLTFDKVIENWKIWIIASVILCIMCPILVPLFGIAFLFVGIYAHKHKKGSRSMFGWSMSIGSAFILLTIIYIVSMCTIHYGISTAYTTIP